ncbi:nucleotidyltransferase family protein [Clostridium coskatii]|uniref:Nucleotidyltransferase domain protein n=1 Tax=Clostridium coskatii TaxID=1705578 RepID=A0A162JDC1_9CLOT|nr:nucleotidyltransferase domain-containing protein [Clostridium coskatii]OAA93675.1 Nucleotidyltransferase domain protein [Clostridium coskatii]OBR89963.1 nucleotidyltransferase domain protein [Clostridium coskatii]
MIDDKFKSELELIFSRYTEIEKVLLFGSRARGDNRNNSDIDLCIFGEGVTHLILAKINMDLNELNTCLSFDILSINEISKEELIENILKEGVVIYNEKIK